MSALPFNRISVIGPGYIGLPTAAMFASRKVEVVGVDVNQSAVDTINRGEVHIVEPDLDMGVRAVVKEGYLRATTVPEPAEALLIAHQLGMRVGQLVSARIGRARLSYECLYDTLAAHFAGVASFMDLIAFSPDPATFRGINERRNPR